MRTKLRCFRGYRNKATMRHWISVNRWVTQSQEFLEQLTSSDDVTFHISGQANGRLWEGRKFSYCGYMKETPQNYKSAVCSGGHMVSVFSLSWKQQLKVIVAVQFCKASSVLHCHSQISQSLLSARRNTLQNASNVRRSLNDLFTHKWIGWTEPVARSSR